MPYFDIRNAIHRENAFPRWSASLSAILFGQCTRPSSGDSFENAVHTFHSRGSIEGVGRFSRLTLEARISSEVISLVQMEFSRGKIEKMTGLFSFRGMNPS